MMKYLPRSVTNQIASLHYMAAAELRHALPTAAASEARIAGARP